MINKYTMFLALLLVTTSKTSSANQYFYDDYSSLIKLVKSVDSVEVTIRGKSVNAKVETFSVLYNLHILKYKGDRAGLRGAFEIVGDTRTKQLYLNVYQDGKSPNKELTEGSWINQGEILFDTQPKIKLLVGKNLTVKACRDDKCDEELAKFSFFKAKK